VHPKDRDIAMVFQNYALYPHMTVRENMAFALKMRKTPKAEIQRRVGATAEMLGLTAVLDRKPAMLSGGQRQRVAVGRAIVREPKAFLFDEPLSNLDAKLRTSTRGEIKALHARLKTTTVYVTHDQEEAMTLADRIAIMNAGELRQHGRPMELYRAPADRFVAGFLGTPAMNFVDGTLEGAGGLTFVGAGGGVRLPINPYIQERLTPLASRPAVLGVRPQALEFAGPRTPAAWPRFTARVELVEPLGDQMDVTLTVVEPAGPGNVRLIARVAPADVKVGERVELAVDPGRVHVFEPGEMGRNLTL
jgi:multiple sugar transport system ATP-binding protein